MKPKTELIITQKIEQRILLIRNKKVMLDRNLAELYGVTTKVLNQAAKRNPQRFPNDFMFQLTEQEFKIWKSQFVTSKSTRMGLRKRPFAFTEHGILMLSSVLKSNKAVFVNIQIMRAFTKLRELMIEHKDLRSRIEDMEKKYDKQFQLVFNAIKQLLAPPPEKPKRPIGFHV